MKYFNPFWLYEHRPQLAALIVGVAVCALFWGNVFWLVYEAIK